jgi:small Trp-rich protein
LAVDRHLSDVFLDVTGIKAIFFGLESGFLLMKYVVVAPVAAWDWWRVLLLSAPALLGWTWADWSGYSQKRAMARDLVRRQPRIEKNRELLWARVKKKWH